MKQTGLKIRSIFSVANAFQSVPNANKQITENQFGLLCYSYNTADVISSTANYFRIHISGAEPRRQLTPNVRDGANAISLSDPQ